MLKKGILVELIGGNFSIQDGLINGSDGVFMHYTVGDPDIIWIDFRNSSIGKSQRQNMKQFYVENIPTNWTPITRISRRIFFQEKPTIRQQFPVQVTCARTIHRSQGLTMDKLAVDPIGIKQHRLIYTALSRIRNVSSLYLLHELHPKNFVVNYKEK